MNNYEISYVEGTLMDSYHHFHPYFEIVFFESGKRTYIIGNNCHEVYSNYAVLITPNTQHSTVGKTPVSRTVVYFTEEFLRRFYTKAAIEKFLLCFEAQLKDLKKYGARFQSILSTMQDAYETKNDILFATLLGTLLTEISGIENNETPVAESSDKPTNSVITQIIVYIQENFSQITNLEDVAKEFYMSVSYLSSLFKRKTGISLKQYIIDARINYACYQLVSTDNNIYKIADMCGFASCTHFCNTFHKKMELSPKQYRKKYHK